MTLTIKQKEGLEISLKRYKDKETHTTIAGYAGTGKTFLVNEIIKKLGLSPIEYEMATFTGKAALRLQQNGFPRAKTLHKLFFKTLKKPGGFIHVPYPPQDFSHLKVIFIDEISMVPNWLLVQAAKSRTHIINLGDPFQLPPIGSDNGMLAKPHIFLDEIVRQNKDNSIIWFSQLLREGKPLPVLKDSFIKVFEEDEVLTGMYLWADQIICGRNDTRSRINSETRKELGFTGLQPVEGEKIIITQNNWELMNQDGYSLVNGLIGEVTGKGSYHEDPMARLVGRQSKIGRISILPDFGSSEFQEIKYDALPFITGLNSYVTDQKAKGIEKVNHLDFGYAITCHKSQGSEYEKVLLFEEQLNSADHARWMYTAITRASKEIVIIKNKNSRLWETEKKVYKQGMVF